MTEVSERFPPSPVIWAIPIGLAVAGSAALGTLYLVRRWRARERPDTGYSGGKPFQIIVVQIDGKPVEIETAMAYRRMADAAAKDGAKLIVVSGFRTMAEQEYLYGCYKSGKCNNGNLAAKPGYSNHQSGHALDLNTRDPAVLAWLRAHAGEYGSNNTVPSEPWHWEYWP